MNLEMPVFLAQAQGQGLIGMVPFLLVIFIFYFLVIRPQQTDQKNHQTLLASLKKDDRVSTTGGLHGQDRRGAGAPRRPGSCRPGSA
jgi:hypothetical protein